MRSLVDKFSNPNAALVTGLGALTGIAVLYFNLVWLLDDPLYYIEALIGGLLSGVMYSLVALGFVLIFKASGVFNFAQGSMVLFAALTFILMFEFAGEADFWNWTGWLALAMALASAAFFVATRYTRVFRTQRTANAVLVGLTLFGVILLAFVFGGELGLWRAIFVTVLMFLAFTVGINYSHAAAAILLGLAAFALLPGELKGLASVFSSDGWGFWRAMIITLVVMMALAIAIERLVMRPLVNQEPIILFMATIGINFFIEGMSQGVWDADVHGFELSFCLSGAGAGCLFDFGNAEDFLIEDFPVEIAGMRIGKLDVFAALVAAALVAGLALFFQRTRVGRALRAVADDHQAALSVGIPLQTIWAIVWAAAGIVALVAGLMWGAKLGVQFSLSLVVLKALPVLILGGFTSIPGAIVGGLLVGATEKIFEGFVGIPYIGGGTENWTPYVMALIFLLFRPQGLFGEKIIERV